MAKPGVFVAFVVVVAACTAPPNSGVGEGEGEGEGQGEGTVVDDETLRAYVEAECFFAGTCQRQDQLAPLRMAACVDRAFAQYRSEESASQRVLRADQMELCRVQLLACDVDLGADSACRRVVDGSVSLNGACRSALDCARPNVCDRDGERCGTCVAPPVGVGDECLDGACGAGRVCDRAQEPDRCVAAPRPGEDCVSGDCDVDAVCDGGLCAPVFREVGDECRTFCNEPSLTGLFCDDGRCAEITPAAAGEPCVPLVVGTRESPVMCTDQGPATPTASACRATDDGGICVAFVDAGDACDDVHACGNSVCVDGTCVVTADGDPCVVDSECGLDAFCDGVCRADRADGEACADTQECQSARCTDGLCGGPAPPIDACVID